MKAAALIVSIVLILFSVRQAARASPKDPPPTPNARVIRALFAQKDAEIAGLRRQIVQLRDALSQRQAVPGGSVSLRDRVEDYDAMMGRVQGDVQSINDALKIEADYTQMSRQAAATGDTQGAVDETEHSLDLSEMVNDYADTLLADLRRALPLHRTILADAEYAADYCEDAPLVPAEHQTDTMRSEGLDQFGLIERR